MNGKWGLPVRERVKIKIYQILNGYPVHLFFKILPVWIEDFLKLNSVFIIKFINKIKVFVKQKKLIHSLNPKKSIVTVNINVFEDCKGEATLHPSLVQQFILKPKILSVKNRQYYQNKFKIINPMKKTKNSEQSIERKLHILSLYTHSLETAYSS